MAEPLLSRKKIVQVKVEAEKGTAETTGLLDVLCFEPDIKPTGPFEQRKAGGLYLGHQVVGIIGEKSGTFSCSVELRGNGTTGMDAGLAEMLQASILAMTSEVYQVASNPANHKSLTIHVYTDGKLEVLYGAMGDVTFEGETGKAIMCNFEFKGIYNTPTDVALPAFAPGTELPPIMANGTFSITAVRKVSKFSLNMNNEVILRPDVNAASGIAHACIVDFDPVVTADLEAELVAAYDIYGAWLAGTEAAMSVVVGSGAGKQITFTLPKLQYRDIPHGDRDGLQINDITAQCNHDSGDDSVAIAVATV